MKWTADFYAPVFGTAADAAPTGKAFVADAADIVSTTAAAAAAATQRVNGFAAAASSSSIAPPFSLTGHDYCFAARKFGGNAQTLTRDRWLHHTSFLWTLDSLPSIEEYLRLPKKQPAYRANRTHGQFLTSMQRVWEQVEQIRATAASAVAGNSATGSQPPFAEPSAAELEALEERTNTLPPSPSPSSLFGSGSSANKLVLPWDHDVSIPSGLPARVLWRLGHFFRLEYPSLQEVAEIVEHYQTVEAPGRSGVKMLDYQEEREREQREARLAEEKEEAKIAAAVAAAAAST
jgi:hypothetical protein